MAYTKKYYNNDLSPDVNIAIEGIAFDLTKVSSDVYETAKKYAIEDVREEAEIEYIEENEDDDLSFEFNEADYGREIAERTKKYIQNALDLPESGVIKVDRKLLDDEEAIKAIAIQFYSEKYGLPVLDIENEKEAKNGDILHQKTFEAYQKMYESDDYITCLDLTENLNSYSPNNIALVFAQNPNAEAVKGFQQWKEFDRSVAKGEHSIQIFAPLLKEFKSADEIEKYCDKNAFYLSQKKDLIDTLKQTGKATIVTGYRSVPVFDIRQTVPLEGKEDNIEELLDKIRGNKPLMKDLQNGENVSEAVSNIISEVFPEMDISSQISDKASEQENIYNILQCYTDKLFNEKPDKIAGIKSMIPSKGEVHQLETIMSAFLAARHIGVDEDDVLKKAAFAMNGIIKDNESLTYRQGKRTVFETAFSRAVNFSHDFNKSFDKEFERMQSLDKQLGKDTTKKKEGGERE